MHDRDSVIFPQVKELVHWCWRPCPCFEADTLLIEAVKDPQAFVDAVNKAKAENQSLISTSDNL